MTKTIQTNKLTGVLLVILCCSYAFAGDTAQSVNEQKSMFAWEQLESIDQLNDEEILFSSLYKDSLILITQTQIHVLQEQARQLHWKASLTTPKPFVGCSFVTMQDSIICIGGMDQQQGSSEVIRLTIDLDKEQIRTEYLPELPGPIMDAGVAQLKDIIYVAGGREQPLGPEMSNFWAMDMSKEPLQWIELDGWEGPARAGAIAGAQDEAFFLFGGINNGQSMTDVYRYDPSLSGQGEWTKVVDMPVLMTKTSSPVISMGQSHLLIFNPGDELSRGIFAYHAITDTWVKMGSISEGIIPKSMVVWKDNIVVISTDAAETDKNIFRITPAAIEGNFGFLDYLSMSIYIIILMWMGIYYARRENNTKDFFLAGQRIPAWAAAITMLGTGVSAITFLTHPAKSYADNWVFIVQNFMAIISVIVTVTIFVPFFRRLRITTAYEYLEMRFNLATRMFCSISYVFAQFGRVGVVLFIPALALSSVTGFNIYACILFMGILATFYTVFGGMEAVVWTDVMQVIILFGGAILCLIILLTDISGGVTEVITVGMEYDKFSLGSLSFDITTDTLWIMLAGQFFFAFLGVSDQTGVQRLLITKDEKEARKSVWIWYVITLFTGVLFYGLGTALFVYYQANPLELNPILQNDSILPWFITTKIPVGVAGLIVSAIFAASMSSVDSSMNSVATVVVVDYYRRFCRQAKEQHAMMIARIVTLLMGIIAITIALVMATYKEQIKSLLEFYWELHALLVATAAGIFLLGMLTKRANGKGAIVGAIGGSSALYFVKVYTDIHFLLYTAIGIVTGMTVGYFVSLLTGRPPEAKVDKLTIYTMEEN